ncbi:SURF1 family protein [Lysobacter humi (ex Lee et al. 2017)]
MSRARLLVGGWILALAVAALFAHLGRWQAGRGDEKQRRLDDVAAVLEARVPRPLAVAGDPRRSGAYDWAAGRGRFVPGSVLLLDNQQRAGRVGVRAYGLFRPDAGAPLLVDLGWLPLPGDRRLPAVALPDGDVEVRGLLAPPPSPGLDVGDALTRRDGAWLMLRVDPAAVAAALRLDAAPAARVLRLDPALPIGHARDLELLANTLTPERHRGYAVQWYGLAITVLVIASVLTYRSRR